MKTSRRGFHIREFKGPPHFFFLRSRWCGPAARAHTPWKHHCCQFQTLSYDKWKILKRQRRGQKQINLLLFLPIPAVHDGQTDRSNRCAQRVPQIYSQKALNLGWTPLAAWLPRTRSTEEDKPSAIHTAAWRNGVGLLRCCLGNDAYSFPPCTLATMLWQVPYLSKLNTARLVASFINSPCSTAATSSARLSESFFLLLSPPTKHHNAFLLYPLQTIRVVDA